MKVSFFSISMLVGALHLLEYDTVQALNLSALSDKAHLHDKDYYELAQGCGEEGEGEGEEGEDGEKKDDATKKQEEDEANIPKWSEFDYEKCKAPVPEYFDPGFMRKVRRMMSEFQQ